MRADEALVDQNFDRARDGEPADAEALGERRLAVDPVAGPLGRDLGAQQIDELEIERLFRIGLQYGRVRLLKVTRLTGQAKHGRARLPSTIVARFGKNASGGGELPTG